MVNPDETCSSHLGFRYSPTGAETPASIAAFFSSHQFPARSVWLVESFSFVTKLYGYPSIDPGAGLSWRKRLAFFEML